MIKHIHIISAEMTKIHRTSLHSAMVYFSLLIWPVIIFFITYYAYKPFDLRAVSEYGIVDFNGLMVFLIIGLLGYNCFWCMVQSAWQMSYERQEGTFEIIFASPANRLALLYGRALGSLFQSMWMLAVFSGIIIFFNQRITSGLIFSIIISFLILLFSSVVWGGFMNAIFIFSRDASFLFNIFDEPMNLLAGTKLPVACFPGWAQALSSLFPLTYCLYIIRSVFLGQSIDMGLMLIFVVMLVVLIIATIVIVGLAEKNGRRTGNFNFY